MPDAPGLELIRGEVNERHDGAVLDTSFDRSQPALVVDSGQILEVLRWLRETPGQEYTFLSSLHAADYLPFTPRFAVHYELLNRNRVERLRVKALLSDPLVTGGTGPAGEADAGTPPREDCAFRGGVPVAALPHIDSCVELYPTAEFQEREVYDMFGIVFRGHPDMTRILLPDDYVGWPQRRDFPVGGEPVLFTHNEVETPRWYE